MGKQKVKIIKSEKEDMGEYLDGLLAGSRGRGGVGGLGHKGQEGAHGGHQVCAQAPLGLLLVAAARRLFYFSRRLLLASFRGGLLVLHQ